MRLPASHALDFLGDVRNIQLNPIEFPLPQQRSLLLRPQVEIGFVVG
jgi:hypothetical protein